MKSGGRPKSTQSAVNIAAVTDLVKNDRRIASRMIAESLNIPKSVVLRILREDLEKRNLCVIQHHILSMHCVYYALIVCTMYLLFVPCIIYCLYLTPATSYLDTGRLARLEVSNRKVRRPAILIQVFLSFPGS
jgi:hypothetical protein